jgi:hypothetical protein
MKAKGIILIFMAAGLILGTASATVNAVTARQTDGENSTRAGDAPFRDGLFQGKLAVQRGVTKDPAIGRWNTEKDRASFVAGYQLGPGERASDMR